MVSKKTDDNFKDQIYVLVKRIPRGKVLTYGRIAKRLRIENSKLKITPRMVGWALHQNRDKEIPCHRVVAQDGRLAANFAGPSKPVRLRSGRSGAFEGAKEHRKRLIAEGVKFKDNINVDLQECLWTEGERQP